MKSAARKTCLHDEHVKLGARMVPFAGWEMPVQYSSIIEEHNCVRNNVGIFDVSHMGEVFVSGKDALAFLQKIVPQDISKLTVGKAVYCQMTNSDGGIIDDLIIYRLEDKNELPFFLLIVNASRVDTDLEWMSKNLKELDMVLDNQSENYSLLAIQGPKSSDLVEKMGIVKQPPYFSIAREAFDDIDVLISRTGYTGEDGFEILVPNDIANKLWSKIIEAGKDYDLKPIGLGARDTLRLEAALHLYGNDMDEQTTPIEASLGWSIPKNKEIDYNGKQAISAQFDKKPQRKLVGFKMVDKAIPRHGYELYKDGQKIGVVTSGGVSPTLQKNIGLGYINSPLSCGDQLEVMVRNKLYKAEIAKRPFVPKSHPKLTELQK